MSSLWTTILLLHAILVIGSSLTKESRDALPDPDPGVVSDTAVRSENHWGSLVCNCQPQVALSDEVEEKLDQIEVLSDRMTQLEEGQAEIKAMLSKLLEEPITTPTPTPTNPTECPPGFQFLLGTQKCFRLYSTETLTWPEASDACNALSGPARLLTLETEDMYLAFENFFRMDLPQGLGRGSWLGGQEVSAEYKWLTGEPLTYTNHWYSGYGQVKPRNKLGICCGSSDPAQCGFFNLAETYNAYFACEIY